MEVFNLIGQKVAAWLQDEVLIGGHYERQFQTNNLSSGVYYYRLTAKQVEANDNRAAFYQQVRKMIVIK